MTVTDFESNRPWPNVFRSSLAACFLFLASLGGCSPAGTPDFDPAWKLDEHGNPDFKPADFGDAVAVLKSSFGGVGKEAAPESSAAARKFRQILRWLPEFAADTPIRRAGWEDLAAQVARLESASRQPGFFTADRAEAFGRDLDALVALIPPDPLYKKLDSHATPEGTQPKPGAEGATSDASAGEPARETITEADNRKPDPKGAER